MTNLVSPTRGSRTRRKTLLGSLAAAAAVVALVVGAPLAAQAAGSLTINGSTPSNPQSVTNGQTLNIAGSGWTSGSYKTLAICNFALGGNNGTHCSAPTGATLGTGTTISATITATRVFTNFNFQTGAPSGGTTTCTTQCYLQISEYPGGSSGSGTPTVTNYPLSF